jgi:transcriptional regulator with GAF, ATPase, and Fis domain
MTEKPRHSNRDVSRLEERFLHADWILGVNPSIRRVAQHVERSAEVGCTVLISGETGTGKEVWAKLIHQLGKRSHKPFVPVNCAALTATLAESQLFGHEKGAFTGALGSALGVFRAADGGVVFLDEVGEMPRELQPKLLRVLQEGEVTPVGASRPVPVDVQIIAATNRDLESEVASGNFREDLFFRLNMVQLNVPPLRERVEDIPAFIEHFTRLYAEKYSRAKWIPDPETLREFCDYPWPGNIRQLSHVIEQSYVLDCAPSLPNRRDSMPVGERLPYFDLIKLRNTALRQALLATGGHKGKAAKLLGVHANTLTRMLSELTEGEEISTS